jgi:nucleoside-diphosphate-sugar epimerase
VTSPAVSSVVLVAGASSPVGDFLLPRLAAAGCRVIALSRAGRAPAAVGGDGEHLVWRTADLAASLPAELEANLLIHLAPLWLLPDRLPEFAACGIERVVALGSTSVYTKSISADRAEFLLAQRLAQAESSLADRSKALGMTWTILRPTMIYGTGRDANIGAVAAFIRRFGFFPVAGKAAGLRAPVHAEDVAGACLAALRADAARNRAYDISGGETLTYRDMVVRIFSAMSLAPRVRALPPALMQALAYAAALAGIPGINADLVRRMNRDQAFAHDEAIRDLDYAPRGFQPRV